MESYFHFKLLLQELHQGHCHQIIEGKQHAWQMGGTLLTMETIGSICKLPSNLWRKSWCYISSIKSNKLKPQKIKRWFDYLTIGLSTRTKTFWNGRRRNILTFLWFLYLPILQMPFNQLMLLCSIESNVHSKRFSTLGWEKWSRNKLTMEWIQKLIS